MSISGYLCQYLSISGYLGQSKAIVCYFWLSLTFSGYLGLFLAISDSLGLTLAILCCIWLYWIISSSVFYLQRSSCIEGHYHWQLKIVFHQILSSIEGCLPSKVVFHQKLSSIKGYSSIKIEDGEKEEKGKEK